MVRDNIEMIKQLSNEISKIGLDIDYIKKKTDMYESLLKELKKDIERAFERLEE
jgi:hypothetical protein